MCVLCVYGVISLCLPAAAAADDCNQDNQTANFLTLLQLGEFFLEIYNILFT